jgi:hypothetical protein
MSGSGGPSWTDVGPCCVAWGTAIAPRWAPCLRLPKLVVTGGACDGLPPRMEDPEEIESEGTGFEAGDSFLPGEDASGAIETPPTGGRGGS